MVEVKESVSVDTIAHAPNITTSFTTVSQLLFTLTVRVHRVTHMTEPSFTESDNLQCHEETCSPASLQHPDHRGYSLHRSDASQGRST